MAQLQTEFEQGLEKEMGRSSIDCGATLYRPVKPGESFECRLAKRDKPEERGKQPDQAKPEEQSAKQSDRETPKQILQVTIQPSGDINWQRIIKVTDPKAVTIAANATKLPTPEATSATTQTESKLSETSKPEASEPEQSPTPPAAKSPEDFLNQPGAADNFD